jgi:hypothetical protein
MKRVRCARAFRKGGACASVCLPFGHSVGGWGLSVMGALSRKVSQTVEDIKNAWRSSSAPSETLSPSPSWGGGQEARRMPASLRAWRKEGRGIQSPHGYRSAQAG